MIIIHAMNILLIDNNPHLQKTLQYFLHPYAPSIYSIDSQEELPQKIDIIFLDSEHKDDEYVSNLTQKKEKPPIVLISRDEKILKELASQYPTSLKKPIQYNQLQEIIHHLIPETRSFKASPYLKFYEKSEPEEQSIALSEQAPPAKKPSPAPLAEEPVKNIPLMPDKDSKENKILKTEKSNKLSPNNLSEEKNQQPTFDKKQAIVIPDDIQLVNEEESTSLHNTNTFLKKVSENIQKKSQAPLKASDTPLKISLDKNVENTEQPPSGILKDSEKSEMNSEIPTNIDNNTEDLITDSKALKTPKDTFSETPTDVQDESIEESTGSQILQSLEKSSHQTPVDIKDQNIEKSTESQISKSPKAPVHETSVELQSENDLEKPSETSSSEKPQPLSVPPDLANTEKWDTLSDKIVEIIDKHFQDKWETFINTQLKKDLKEMIHKEVTQVFKEQMKDILTTEGIQSIKKASEEISWKVIPELSKQIIQKEIKKLLNKPSSK